MHVNRTNLFQRHRHKRSQQRASPTSPGKQPPVLETGWKAPISKTATIFTITSCAVDASFSVPLKT
ncbi:hypothetical protein CC79DRAFT_909547 [Sarocladium strictum]